MAVLSATALTGTAIVVARLRRWGRSGGRVALFPAARDGYAYLVLALATRFTIQQHESRLQILALLVVVAAVEAARFHPGEAPQRGTTWLAGSAAVCAGVVMAKWALEPGALTDAFDRFVATQ